MIEYLRVLEALRAVEVVLGVMAAFAYLGFFFDIDMRPRRRRA